MTKIVKIDWHPFPEERPEAKYGIYYVLTLLHRATGERYVQEARWERDDDEPDGYWLWHEEYPYTDDVVIAWGEDYRVEPYDAPIMNEGINLFNSPLD